MIIIIVTLISIIIVIIPFSPLSKYPYRDQLRALESFKPPFPVIQPAGLKQITTPLDSALWEEALSSHPDKQFAEYVVSGIKEGFRIGFNYGCKVVSSKNDMLSALENPQVIEDYLQNEVQLNRMWRAPASNPITSQCQVSPFGVIPKKEQAREVAADCGFISARGCKHQ